jgi:hypothetical protein
MTGGPDPDVPEAAPRDVTFRLSWAERDGGLVGHLDAENVSDRAVRLSGKPGLVPLDEAGDPLGAKTIVTMELRLPGYAVLEPGQVARADVGWAGWDGTPASGRVLVRWEGGEAEVVADGPAQPVASGPATTLSSSWFTTLRESTP